MRNEKWVKIEKVLQERVIDIGEKQSNKKGRDKKQKWSSKGRDKIKWSSKGRNQKKKMVLNRERQKKWSVQSKKGREQENEKVKEIVRRVIERRMYHKILMGENTTTSNCNNNLKSPSEKVPNFKYKTTSAWFKNTTYNEKKKKKNS